MSRTGYVISYTNFPIIRCSNLMIEIAVLTTESENIVLFQSMRDVIPLMELLRELKEVVPAKTSASPSAALFLKITRDALIW